jgi:hypothetical protein
MLFVRLSHWSCAARLRVPCIVSAAMRGGHRQQREMMLSMQDEAQPTDDSHDYECPLEQVLLREFAWGDMQATAVQRVAHASLMSGVSHPSICNIAAMGGFGQNPQHIHLQLTTLYGKGMKMPAVQPITVPCIDPHVDLLEVQYRTTGVFYFHEWIAALSEHYPLDFERIFGTDKCRDFWDACDPSGT